MILGTQNFKEWGPLAQQGDAESQYNLGVIYRNGEGVPQDNTENEFAPFSRFGFLFLFIFYTFSLRHLSST